MNAPPAVFEADVIEERMTFASRGRSLEGVLAYRGEADPTCSVLIAGPHPFMGGDMENNVVRALAAGLAARGALTLAFNYSGVGNSQGGPDDWHRAASQFWECGAIDHESAWLDDALAARTALDHWSISPRIEIGYSFGCWVIAEMPPDASDRARVLISPNPNRHRFDRFSAGGAPLLVVHSDNDFACPPNDIRAWFEGVRSPKTLKMIDAGEHFFRGKEQNVLTAVIEFLVAERVL